MLTRPFKYDIVDVVQAGCLLQLLLTYLTAFIFLDDGAQNTMRENLDNDEYLGFALIGINCIAFFILFASMGIEIVRTRRLARARRLRFVENHGVVTPGDFQYKLIGGKGNRLAEKAKEAANKAKEVAKVAAKGGAGSSDLRVASGAPMISAFHIFLSHVWSTGQDTMRTVKMRLSEMVPGMLVFLDVDNLKVGKGAEFVDASCVCLVFCTRGYFQSINCMRELLRAVCMDKPIVTLLEPDHNKGRLTRAEILDQLIEGEKQDGWKLAGEVHGWKMAMPTAVKIYERLFPDNELPIEWDRVLAFQNVTLCNIAASLLSKDKEVFLQAGKLAKKTHVHAPRGNTKYHLFCSQHNPGAETFTQLLDDTANDSVGKKPKTRRGFSPTRKRAPQPGQSIKTTRTIKATSNAEQLKACERMLIYLTADTWAEDDPLRVDALVKEIASAMALGVELFLVHEAPGDDSYAAIEGARPACDFGDFFKNTPSALLEAGIYSTISKVAKGGLLRATSLQLLVHSLNEYQGRNPPVVVPGVALDPDVVPNAYALELPPDEADGDLLGIDFDEARDEPVATLDDLMSGLDAAPAPPAQSNNPLDDLMSGLEAGAGAPDDATYRTDTPAVNDDSPFGGFESQIKNIFSANAFLRGLSNRDAEDAAVAGTGSPVKAEPAASPQPKPFTLSDEKLGIATSDEADGAVIRRVKAGSQAEALGVPIGGKITLINGAVAPTNKKDLNAQLVSASRPVTLHITPFAPSAELAEQVEAMIRSFDVDGGSVIEPAEFHTLLLRTNPKVTLEETKQIYTELLNSGYDADGDGQLSVSELTAYWIEMNEKKSASLTA